MRKLFKAFLWLGVVVIGLSGAWLFVGPAMLDAPPRLGIASTPGDFGLSYEETQVTTEDGVEIKGWWIPGQEEAKGILILAHGYSSNRADPFAHALWIMKAVHDHGYHVLTIDQRNHGESGKAPGGRVTFGITEANDVMAAVDLAEEKAPGAKVAVLGISMGGATALYAAARDPRIDAILLFDPLLEPRRTAVNMFSGIFPGPRAYWEAYVWIAVNLYGAPVDEDGPAEAGRSISDRPILLISNEGDPVAEPAAAKRLAAAGDNIELWLAPAADPDHLAWMFSGPWGMHVRSYEVWPAAFVERVTEFLDRTIGSDGAGASRVTLSGDD